MSWDYFNNSDVSEFNKNNPEILVFYQEYDVHSLVCRKKTVNLFNYDYPCNCRKFGISNADVVSDFRVDILPRVFKKWTMLEAIVLRAWYGNDVDTIHINFTQNLLNLPYLRSFNVEGYNVGYIDESIEQLKKLEVFKLTDINTPISIPWQNIAKLPNLKALYIREMVGSIATTLNFEYFCQTTSLLFFTLRYPNLNNAINISDCIDKLTNLRYFEVTFDTSSDESYISPLLYTLPKLRTVIIQSWRYDLNSLINFTSYKMTNNAQVYWSESDLCLPVGFEDEFEMNINISSTILMTHLDWYIESGVLSNAALIDFAGRFNPCRNPCGAGSIEDSFACTAFSWGDGICNRDLCFNELCNYDNGDCNQECPCNRTLWFNDQCDTECNVTECDWDFFQCLDVNGTCYHNESNLNATCYKEWTLEKDGWCDDNCRNLGNDTCGENEEQACICSGYCATAKTVLVDIIGSAEPPIGLITLNEVCLQWDLIKLRTAYLLSFLWVYFSFYI